MVAESVRALSFNLASSHLKVDGLNLSASVCINLEIWVALLVLSD